jgi:hypothetical protein
MAVKVLRLCSEHPVGIWIRRQTEDENFYFVKLVFYDLSYLVVNLSLSSPQIKE